MNLSNMLKRLTSNYTRIENTNIYKLFSIVATSVEETKNLFEKISSWQGIKNAEGETLDLIGQEVRQPRNGMTDEEYRPTLNFKNAIDLSGTDINSVNNAMNVITQGNFLYLQEGYNSKLKEPASVIINLKDYSKSINYNRVDEVLAAGVRAYLNVTKESISVTYIASATLSGETISIFPYNLKEVEVKGNINIASGYNTSYEITQINPKI